MYFGLPTDQNNSIYYNANGTTGRYSTGSVSSTSSLAYGWSLQGLAVPVGANSVESADADGVGQPNYLDLDSDNDGIYDVDEAGGTDTNGDGMADDTDGDSTNNNGIPSTAGSGLAPTDSDSDGRANPYDTDHDNNGAEDPVFDSAIDTVVCSLDGAYLNTVDEGWREAMVGTISLYNCDGDREHTICFGAAPEYGKEKFYQRYEQELSHVNGSILMLSILMLSIWVLQTGR